MRLSDADRRSLSQIAGVLEAEDPEFARLMQGPTPDRDTGSLSSRRRFRRTIAFWVMVGLVPVALGMLTVGIVLGQASAIAIAGTLLLVDAACALVFRARRNSGRRS